MAANTTSEKYGPVIKTFNYATLLVSIVIVFCEIVAVFILQRCKRMPARSRILSTSFILSDAAGAFIFMIHQIIIFVLGINNDVTHNSRILAVGTTLTVSWACVASMSLERVAALKLNIKYTLNTSRFRVYLLISLIWGLHIFAIVGVAVAGVKTHCDWEFDTCDMWKATKACRFFMMSLLLLYEIILIISYVIIHGIAIRHVKNVIAHKRAAFGGTTKNPDTVSERQYATTKAIIKIVLAFILLHAPIMIHLFIFENDVSLRNETKRRIFHALSYVCIQMNSFVSVHLYVAKFDECKLYFYLLLSRIFKGYESRAEELRVKVYDIVVSSERR